ncbi:MAG: metal ABC transporter permease [Geminicoccaceae bacterium]|nr:metal ABC transporter permease [Geminicoccaceae bacterium]
MIPDFLLRAWLAGVGLAAVAGPLGCFVVWRRMAYFGDTLAHSALLGVTVGLLLGVNLVLAVAVACLLIACLVVLAQGQKRLATDTVLGILAHSSLALGLVTLGLVDWLRVDLMGYLFGDILAVSSLDLRLIWLGGPLLLLALWRLWPSLLFATLHEEMAQAEGLPVLALRLALMLMVALLIAAAMKIVGVLLITAMLILPPAASRVVARTPEAMAIGAALAGIAAVTGGLWFSLWADTPAGPSVVVAALVLFGLAQVGRLAVRV